MSQVVTHFASQNTYKSSSFLFQLMSRLLSHNCVGEELARKDDLNLLFSGVSSWCPKHSQMWRRATAQLLMTLSSRVMTQIVINYIHCE